VEYSLSEMGRAFLPVLDELECWGGRYIDYLNGKKKSEQST
jgi:DNA-binding HxlR family transcriptional regulator